MSKVKVHAQETKFCIFFFQIQIKRQFEQCYVFCSNKVKVKVIGQIKRAMEYSETFESVNIKW